MTSIEPQLWIARAAAAVDFYERGFGAAVLHLVGDGDDIVAQLAVGEARFWVSAADPAARPRDPPAVGGTTGRTLLVVDDPPAMHGRAVAAGATVTSPVQDEHGWLLGRIVDPFGHEWELGRPLRAWPRAVGEAASCSGEPPAASIQTTCSRPGPTPTSTIGTPTNSSTKSRNAPADAGSSDSSRPFG